MYDYANYRIDLTNQTNISSQINYLKSLSISNVYNLNNGFRCLGSNDLTSYVIIEKLSSNFNLKVNDIIYNTNKVRFLENIDSISQIDNLLFVETHLIQCNSSIKLNKLIQIDSFNLECNNFDTNSNLGLFAFNSSNTDIINNILIGRYLDVGYLLQIKQIYEIDKYLLLECNPFNLNINSNDKSYNIQITDKCDINQPLNIVLPSSHIFNNNCDQCCSSNVKIEETIADNIEYSFNLDDDEIISLIDLNFEIENNQECTYNCSCDCNCLNINYTKLDECYQFLNRPDCSCKCKCDYCESNGQISNLVNTKYLECGNPPNCGPDRTGCQCELPYCSKCKNGKCSQGVCVRNSTCGSVCECEPLWGGECCDEISSNAYKDIHLKSLNGEQYDFQEIGDYWYCFDNRTNLGVQLRLSYLESNKASWITGVSILTSRQTVITIYVEKNNTVTIRNGQKILKYTNLIEYIQKPEEFLQITPPNIIYVRQPSVDHSSISLSFANDHLDINNFVLKRTMNTSGLCGNQIEKEFLGPNRKIFSRFYDTRKILTMSDFGKSWKALDSLGNKLTRWFWNSSNFHDQDVFYDFKTKPKVKRSITSPEQICEKFDIKDETLYKNCLLDAEVGGSEEYAESDIYKSTWCPTKCNSRGTCIGPNNCSCIENWTGEDCSISKCPYDCGVNGVCGDSICVCNVGWEGLNCTEEANCEMLNNCTSINQGRCERTNRCLCNDGFTGANCSDIADCTLFNNCSSKCILI